MGCTGWVIPALLFSLTCLCIDWWGVVRSLSVGELGRVGFSSQHKQLTSTWQFTGPHSSDQQRTGNSVNQWRPTCCKTTAVTTPTWPLKSVTHSAATHFKKKLCKKSYAFTLWFDYRAYNVSIHLEMVFEQVVVHWCCQFWDWPLLR